MSSGESQPLKLGHKVCVIGAGTMGSGIAAHLANVGFSVSLLDASRDSVKAAFDRAKANRPPHFYVPQTSEAIKLGGIDSDLDLVSEADWVCEAIIEKLDAKKNLFEQIEPLLKPNALVSTNTSGLQISLLTEGRSESFKRRFLGTHFFNPPRHLKLLELIPTEDTDPAVVEQASRFLEDRCARRVVVAKDTPGFIANRFGMWSMYYAVHVAERLGLTVEMVDEFTGPLIGRPRSASFRLNDLVGLDIMHDIAQNLITRCPHDAQTKWLNDPASLAVLREKGWIGNKAGLGYYKKEGKDFVVYDLRTGAYREQNLPVFEGLAELNRKPLYERLHQALGRKDVVGDYLREYLLPSLRYADSLKEEISHNVRDFDRVMKWGFGWEAGPFELLDMIGPEKAGVKGGVFYQSMPNGDSKVRMFSGEYREFPEESSFRPIRAYPLKSSHATFNVRDLGDGVDAVCTTTKMGSFSPELVAELTEFLKTSPPARFVLTSEAKSFSAGYDLRFFADQIQAGDYQKIADGIEAFQQLGRLLQQQTCVAAVWGFCLGGGYEMASCCAGIIASPETQIGLPEAKVGLIPGGGGTVRARQEIQTKGAKAYIDRILDLTKGFVASNADEARVLGLIHPGDATCYHPDRLVLEAKQAALQAKPRPSVGWVQAPGPIAGMAKDALKALVEKGELTQHDAVIGDRIAHVFAKATSLDHAFELERSAFVELCREGFSLARIKHMLEKGKPLRN